MFILRFMILFLATNNNRHPVLQLCISLLHRYLLPIGSLRSPDPLSKHTFHSFISSLFSFFQKFESRWVDNGFNFPVTHRQISKHHGTPINPYCLSAWLWVLREDSHRHLIAFDHLLLFQRACLCVCVARINTSYWSQLPLHSHRLTDLQEAIISRVIGSSFARKYAELTRSVAGTLFLTRR